MILGSGLIQSASSFVGAYDAIPSIAAAYSTRRLLSSYTGPLLRLVADRTGYPEQDVGYTAEGDLDTAAVTSFLAGDTGYVTKWHDQSGNKRDVVQATLAAMPEYVPSWQNGRPALRGYGTDTLYFAVSPTIPLPISVISVLASTEISNGRIFSLAANTDLHNNNPARYNTQTNFNGLSAGVISSASIISVVFSSTAVVENWTNGVSTGTDNPNDQNVDQIGILSRYNAATAGTAARAHISEFVFVTADLSTTNRTAAESAANTYWSIY